MASPPVPPEAAPPHPGWWTWANLLTALRLASVPCMFTSIHDGAWGIALAVYSFAVATDLADGPVARARGESSPLGGLLDHATDACFVVVALTALAAEGLVSFMLPPLVALAFIQYVLDSRVVDGRTLRTSWIGRWNGILYFVPVGTVVVREAFDVGLPSDAVVLWMSLALVASTLVSMIDRAIAYARQLAG